MAPPNANEANAGGFFDNLGLKAISLGVAVALYAVVHGTQDAQQTFSVPIVASLPRTELVLSEPLPATIQVSLRGPRAKLRDLRAEGIAPITVDLEAADKERLELDGAQLDLPAGVRAEHIDPAELSLHWEKPISRVIPVHVSLSAMPPGLVLDGPPVIEPSTVMVRGLARRLEVLQGAATDTIDFSRSTRGAGERRVALVVPDGLLAVEPSQVTVRFTLRDATSVQSFAHVPVVVAGAANAKTQPATVAVRFECPIEGRIPARAEDVVAFVRAPDAHVDLADVQVEKGLCTVEVTPARVIVRH
jgi:YbbR domain-containing protein